MFQELIGGASEEIERRVDGAAERFYGQIETSVSAATGSLDQANKTFQDVMTGTATVVPEEARDRVGGRVCSTASGSQSAPDRPT